MCTEMFRPTAAILQISRCVMPPLSFIKTVTRVVKRRFNSYQLTVENLQVYPLLRNVVKCWSPAGLCSSAASVLPSDTVSDLLCPHSCRRYSTIGFGDGDGISVFCAYAYPRIAGPGSSAVTTSISSVRRMLRDHLRSADTLL